MARGEEALELANYQDRELEMDYEAWKLLQKFEGVQLAPNYGPPRAGDVRDSQADTTGAVRDLGHAPQYSFEQGLRLTLEWFRSR